MVPPLTRPSSTTRYDSVREKLFMIHGPVDDDLLADEFNSGDNLDSSTFSRKEGRSYQWDTVDGKQSASTPATGRRTRRKRPSTQRRLMEEGISSSRNRIDYFGSSDDFDDDDGEDRFDGGMSPRERRKQKRQHGRRRRSSQSSPSTIARSFQRVLVNFVQGISDDFLPERVIRVGTQVFRRTSSTARRWFDDLVEYTFVIGENDDDEVYDGDDDVEEESIPSRQVGRSISRLTSRRNREERDVVQGTKRRDPVHQEKSTLEKTEERISQDDSSFHSSQSVKTSGRISTTSPTEIISPEEADAHWETPRDQRPSLREILSVLNDNNIVYSPKATREELEVLYRAVMDSEAYNPAQETSASATSRTERHPDDYTTATVSHEWEVTSRVQKVPRRKIPSSEGRNKGDKAYRSIQTSSTRLSQQEENPRARTLDTTPIIVDAVVERFSQIDEGRDAIIDIEDEYLYQEGRSPSRLDEGRGMSRKAIPSSRARKSRRKRSLEQYQEMNEIEDVSIPRLLPADEEQQTNVRTRNGKSRTRGTRSSEGTEPISDRKIYSPYRNRDIYVDGLDNIGDLFARTVDSVLWGDSDTEQGTASNHRNASNRTKRRTVDSPPRRARSGHWKDRMEEQFDYIMGIHEDGKYYRRWSTQEFHDDQVAEGTDAVSYARGRSPRQRRRISTGSPWEGEDTLLGMLFGAEDRSPSLVGSGSMLRLLRTLTRFSVVFLSALCRWASVRGSLPKPVVAVAAVSAVLCSRPGFRIRNLALSLLSIRAVGEFLHGYMYEEEDF